MFVSSVAPLILSLFLSGSVPDDLCLLRVNPNTPRQKLWVFVHRPAADGDLIYGDARASDLKFQKLRGKRPVRFAFAAQWDGRRQDELVIVREHKRSRDRRLELRVYGLPGQLFGNTGRPLVRSRRADLGVAEGDGRIVAIGPIDSDGDQVDELAVIREAADGRQWLEVRDFPRSRDDRMGSPTRSDQSFGQAGSDANFALFGSDVDGDGEQELVTLRRSESGPDRLLVFKLPTQPGGETGPPIRSDLDLEPVDGGRNLGLWRLRDRAGGPHQALLLRAAPDGRQRLELFGLPPGPASDVGAPLKTQLDVVGSGADLFAAFAVPDLPDPPWEEFNGPWTLTLRIAYQDQAGNIFTRWVGPFAGFSATALPSRELRLNFPPGTTVGRDKFEGTLTGFETGDLLRFPSYVLYYQTIRFYPTTASGVVQPGDRITITYPVGVLTNPIDGPPSIAGQSVNGITIGEVVAPNTDLKAVVYEYRFDRH